MAQDSAKKTYFIIAGKTEGFDYSDAKIVGIDGDIDTVDLYVNELREEGYVIMLIAEQIARIDDIAAVANAQYEALRKLGKQTQKTANQTGESLGNISVKITADVDEAVAGLKRLQRVARETTRQLREVESLTVSGRVDLSGVPTKELVDELARRDDIELFDIGYGDRYEVWHYFNDEYVAQGDPYHYSVFGFGPAKVIVVKGEGE